jgi:hypothetical protein
MPTLLPHSNDRMHNIQNAHRAHSFFTGTRLLFAFALPTTHRASCILLTLGTPLSEFGCRCHTTIEIPTLASSA